MTDYALSHFIHLCRFIPTLELHLPYTAHWPRSETGVSNSNTYCQVSEHFFYWLGPYSSESELTASTGLAIVKRIHIRWGQDRLQCLNLEVRSENDVLDEFLATCTGHIFYSTAPNPVVAHYHSTCGELRTVPLYVVGVLLDGKIQLDRVLSLSSQLSTGICQGSSSRTLLFKSPWEMGFWITLPATVSDYTCATLGSQSEACVQKIA